MRRILPFAIALVIILVAWMRAPAQSESKDWLTDMDRAMQRAAAEDKDLLLDFTGSDWCSWCLRLNEEVFSKPEFEEVEQHFVLVELDFPADPARISDEVRQQNEKWRQRLGVDGFPTIFLTDADGRPYAMTGYREGGVGPYLEHLNELRKIRVARDEAFAAAEQAKGIERARHLHEGLSAMHGDFVMANYRDEMEEIIALDPQNQTGVRDEYEQLLAEADAAEKIQEIETRLDELLAAYDPSGAAAGGEAAETATVDGADDIPQRVVRLLADELELAQAEDNSILQRRIRQLQLDLLPALGHAEDAVAVANALLEDPGLSPEERLTFEIQRAYILVEADQHAEALRQLDKLIEQLDSPEAKASLMFTKGQVLHGTDKREDALATFTRLSELGEEGSSYWIYGQHYRGMLLEELGRTTEALAVYEQLLATEGLEMPIRVSALTRQASALLASGKQSAAVAAAKQAQEMLDFAAGDDFAGDWVDEARERIGTVLRAAEQTE